MRLVAEAELGNGDRLCMGEGSGATIDGRAQRGGDGCIYMREIKGRARKETPLGVQFGNGDEEGNRGGRKERGHEVEDGGADR